MEVGDGLPRRGSRGSGPQGRALWGGAWLVGRLAKGAEAGWRRGRRGTALVLVAVGSRARLPGGLVRVSVGAPFPEPVPSSARALSGPRFVRVPPPRTLRPTSRSVLLFFFPLRLGSDDRARVRPFSSPSPVTVSGPRPGLAACRVPAPPLGRHGSWGAGSRAECCRPRSRERRNGGKKRERGAGCARRGSGRGGARVVGRRACGRAFQGPVARLLRVAGPEGPLRGFAPGFAEGAGRVGVRGCHGTALVLEASGGGTPCAPRWRLGSAPSRRLVGNPWGSLAVGPRSCSPSLFAGASLPLPPGVRVVASSVRLPNPVARSGVWALPRPAAASSPCPPPPSGVGPVPRGRGRSVRHARSLRGGTGPVLSGRGARACSSAFPSPRAPAPRGGGGPPPPPPPARRHRPAASRPRAPYARSTVRRVPPPGARSLWLTALLPG